MGKYLPVQSYFSAVYLVDLSPSLCEVARARFKRLRWDNVHVVCEDARYFKLEDYEHRKNHSNAISLWTEKDAAKGAELQFDGVADVITLSFALSMIPEFYPVVDTLTTLLSPQGIIGVCDFYVQNMIDYRSRNYTGGFIDRHCNFLSRVFWRTWFEVIVEICTKNFQAQF